MKVFGCAELKGVCEGRELEFLLFQFCFAIKGYSSNEVLESRHSGAIIAEAVQL